VLDFTKYEWLSFDCYGTLVDWETGISRAVDEVLKARGVSRTQAEILAMFSEAEPRAQTSGEFQDYCQVLRSVMEVMASDAGIELSGNEPDCLSGSLPRWPIFAEAPRALKELQSRFKLAVISNVDDHLFGQSEEALGVKFDAVITSQQAGSYKPNLRNFEAAKERMNVEKGRWLHIGESLYHDIGPASLFGIDSVWVKRPDRGGGTRPTDAEPSLTVPDLAALAKAAGVS